MKQFESKSVSLSDAAAVIYERSNTDNRKLPVLTIMTPFRPGQAEDRDVPPASVRLENAEVEMLYKFLDDYYYTK